MATFYVKADKLKNTAGDMSQIQHSVKHIGNDVQSVVKVLSREGGSYAEIAQKLARECQKIEHAETTLGKMKINTERISSLYQTTEKSIVTQMGKSKKSTGKAKKGKGGAAPSIWDRLTERYKERVRREEEIYKKIAKELKYTAGWWVDKYKKHKDTIEKIYKTGKAVVTIAGSAVAIAAMWGLTAGSAGIGTPLAALGTIYAGDAIINATCDIIDLWGGNPGHAGKNHALQDAMKNGGKDLGRMLGNEELGEIIGNGIYYTGKVVSVAATIEAVAGKVIQGPDMAAEASKAVHEVKTGFGGVVDIVTHTALNPSLNPKTIISPVLYDMQLLGYEIPHVVNVLEGVQILREVADTSKSLFEAGASYITDIFDCRSAAA